MRFSRTILAGVFASFAVTAFSAVSTPAASSKASSADLATINAAASSKGWVPVVVSFNIDSSLQALAQNASGIAKQAQQMEQKLLASLGSNALSSVVYRNGIGQVELYVRPAALPLLDADSTVARYWFNTGTDAHRTVGSQDDIADIEASILKNGYADVEAVLNIDHYDMGGGAQSDAWLAAQKQEVLKVLPALQTTIPSGATAFSAASAAANTLTLGGTTAPGATQTLRIKQEDLYAMLGNASIRNLRLSGSTAKKLAAPVVIDPTALQEAQKNGAVTLVVVLKPAANYSPFISKMSPIALQAQTQAIKSAFYDAFNGYTNKELLSIKEAPGFNFVAVNLTPQGVQRLISNPPAAIAAVGVSRQAKTVSSFASPVGTPSMLVTSIPGVSCATPNACTVAGTSAALVGAPVAWALSNGDGTKVDGHNVTVAVVDTGVHKSHVALQDATAHTRVIFEGCFGTDSGSIYSRCLQKNSAGDSPFGLPGSGLPEYNAWKASATVFNHGTRVAGIAAGVAPKASLASINISSDGSSLAGTYIDFNVWDTINALQAIDANKASYGGNVVVNVSLNFPDDCSDPTNAIYQATKAVVDDLVNAGNIPVIVGAGNNGNSIVTLPACLPSAISVAGTYVAAPAGYAPANRSYFWNQTTYNDSVTFAAPAAFVTAPSTKPNDSSANDFYDGTEAGTSFAAPHVSALYALAKSSDGLKSFTVSGLNQWFTSALGAVWMKSGTTYTCKQKLIQVVANSSQITHCP